MNRLSWLNIALVCAVCMLGFSPTASNAASQKVLCIGDSITEGTYVDGSWVKGESWVTVLQELAGENLRVVNGGKSGRRTYDFESIHEVIDRHDNINHVIFFLGVNDMKTSTDEYRKGCVANIDKLIDAARECYGDIEVTILSSPGLDVNNMAPVFFNEGYDAKEQAQLDKLRREYRRLAAKKNCHFIDLWGVVTAGNYTDGLHPNRDGQRQIGEAVWDSWPSSRGSDHGSSGRIRSSQNSDSTEK